MAQSKVPKFGGWTGGESYTVVFNEARKEKKNGPMVNPNDPQENPGVTSHKGVPTTQASSSQQAEAPKFGEWNNGVNKGSGYTGYFNKVQETKNVRDGSTDPKPGTKVIPDLEEKKRRTVPAFGGWVNPSGGEEGYTVLFDNVREDKGMPRNLKESSREPQLNRDIRPPSSQARAQDARVRVTPEQRGSKQDGHESNASRGSIVSSVESERRARQPRVSQIPERKTSPSKPVEYNGTFATVKEEKKTPLNQNASSSYNNQTQSKGQPQPKKEAITPPLPIRKGDPSKIVGSNNNNQAQSKEKPKKSPWYFFWK